MRDGQITFVHAYLYIPTSIRASDAHAGRSLRVRAARFVPTHRAHRTYTHGQPSAHPSRHRLLNALPNHNKATRCATSLARRCCRLLSRQSLSVWFSVLTRTSKFGVFITYNLPIGSKVVPFWDYLIGS